jgi:hypothetical protein
MKGFHSLILNVTSKSCFVFSFSSSLFSFDIRVGVTVDAEQIEKGYLGIKLKPETRLQFLVCGPKKVLDPNSSNKRYRFVVLIFQKHLVTPLQTLLEVCECVRSLLIVLPNIPS